MLELMEVRWQNRIDFIVFSRANHASKNFAVHGSFKTYKNAKKLFEKLVDELGYVINDEIPASRYAKASV